MTFQPPFDAEFVLTHTHVAHGTLVPEIPLYLLNPKSPLVQFNEVDLETSPFGNPYWAIAWSGSQAISRYILDNPELVRGRRVLDFAAGCGLAAIAAAQSGASHILANDIDPICEHAICLNAKLNHVDISFTHENLLLLEPPRSDVILAGDVCYEEPLATQVMRWLQQAVQAGSTVLLGDPGRTFLPKSRQRELQRYRAETIEIWEDTDVTRACVRRVLADPKL